MKTMFMKYLFLFLLVMLTESHLLGCSCVELQALDRQSCSIYDVVFTGEVKSVSDCNEENQDVIFQVDELFIGSIDREVEVKVNCGLQDCFTDFVEGQHWILFAKLNNAQQFKFDHCGHSRLFVKEGQKDYTEEIRGTSFFQDKAYLDDNYESNAYYEAGLKPRKYKKVEKQQVVYLLLASSLFMFVGFFVSKKWKKKQ